MRLRNGKNLRTRAREGISESAYEDQGTTCTWKVAVEAPKYRPLTEAVPTLTPVMHAPASVTPQPALMIDVSLDVTKNRSSCVFSTCPESNVTFAPRPNRPPAMLNVVGGEMVRLVIRLTVMFCPPEFR